MTIAEKVAKILTEKFWVDMQNPLYRGSKFNPLKFDIEGYVDVHLFVYYKIGKVPSKSREKALLLTRKIWNEKIERTNLNDFKRYRIKDYLFNYCWFTFIQFEYSY
jgi:hypothetical protein